MKKYFVSFILIFSLWDNRFNCNYPQLIFWYHDWLCRFNHSIVVSEDGLPCQPTKTLDQTRRRVFLWFCQEWLTLDLLYRMRKINIVFEELGEQDVLIAAISSSPSFINQKAGLLKDTGVQVAFGKTSLTIFEFLPRENFNWVVVQDKQIITAIGFASRVCKESDSKSRVGREYGHYFKEKKILRVLWRGFVIYSIRWESLIKWLVWKHLKIYIKIIEKRQECSGNCGGSEVSYSV